MITRTLSVLLAGILVAHAQQPKQSHFAIFASPAYTVDKRMDLVLALTPEQETRIEVAYTAMREDAQVKETNAAFKATDGQQSEEARSAKQAFYEARAAAEKRYQDTVAEILTGEQKSLVETVNTWVSLLAKEVKDGEGGWNGYMARLHEAGKSRLSEVLSPAQIALLGSETAGKP